MNLQTSDELDEIYFTPGSLVGKNLVVLVGSRKALEIAVKRMDTERRCSTLAGRLQNEHEQKSQPNPNVPSDQLFGW